MHARAVILICILVIGMARVADAAASPWFPLSVGNKWEYSITKTAAMTLTEGKQSSSMHSESEGTCVEEVLAIKDTQAAGTVYEHRATTKMKEARNSPAEESVADSLVLASKNGVYITATKASGMDGLLSDEWESYKPPLMIYAKDLKVGTRWIIGTVREDKLRLPMVAKVIGKETITVPAGTFANCLKMQVMCTKVSGSMGEGADKAAIKDGKSVTTVWVARGIGTVKEDSLFQAKMEFPPDKKGQAITMTATQRKIKELQPGYVVDSK